MFLAGPQERLQWHQAPCPPVARGEGPGASPESAREALGVLILGLKPTRHSHLKAEGSRVGPGAGRREPGRGARCGWWHGRCPWAFWNLPESAQWRGDRVAVSVHWRGTVHSYARRAHAGAVMRLLLGTPASRRPLLVNCQFSGALAVPAGERGTDVFISFHVKPAAAERQGIGCPTGPPGRDESGPGRGPWGGFGSRPSPQRSPRA